MVKWAGLENRSIRKGTASSNLALSAKFSLNKFLLERAENDIIYKVTVAIAQWLERLPVEQDVAGSSPVSHPKILILLLKT